MLNLLPEDRKRWWTHLILLGLTVVATYITFLLLSEIRLRRVIAIATGYVALILLVLSLLIGPFELLRHRRRRNPVNMMVRRDVGIWVALTAVVHVIFSFQSHMGGRILRFFFERTEAGIRPLYSWFGASNYIGAAATVLVVGLFAISNDISLRKLKGKRWKNIQRFNYALFLLTLAHTFAYQEIIDRHPFLQWLTILLTVSVVALQLSGFFFIRRQAN